MEVDDDARGGVVAVEGTEAPPADRSAPPSATGACRAAVVLRHACQHIGGLTPNTGASRRCVQSPQEGPAAAQLAMPIRRRREPAGRAGGARSNRPS